jgi:hypothetical protein
MMISLPDAPPGQRWFKAVYPELGHHARGERLHDLLHRLLSATSPVGVGPVDPDHE